MKCPKDNNELTMKSKEGIVGHCCGKCGGIFLKGSGMKAFKLNFETDILESTFKISSSADSPLSCASCNHQMQLARIDDTEIDICKNCQGVWFDAGEAKYIISHYRQNLTDLEVTGMDIAVIPFPFDLIYGLYKVYRYKSK